MLRRHRDYTSLATDFTGHVLLRDTVDGFLGQLLTGNELVMEMDGR